MVEELLRRGGEFEAAGDLSAAEAAYREADNLNDPEGAILLGLLLQRRGEPQNAAEAFHRDDARGHREAGSCLGNFFSDNGDMPGRKAAYERAVAAGSPDAILNLGVMLADEGAIEDALHYLRSAQENDESIASWVIGRLLEGQEDLKGAADAYRQGAVGGNPQAAYALGTLSYKLEDREGARTAFQRADELGHEGAREIVESLETEDAAQDAARLANLYVAACKQVVSATNACLEVANRAVGARNMAAQRPQHEISLRKFTKFAVEAEEEFESIYESCAKVSATAPQAADQLLATHPNPDDIERSLSRSVGTDVLNGVATARAILTANYGRSPAGFVQGVEETNQLMQVVFDGNIYRPPISSASDERTCPWCAETIKAAAVICRFCGRDIHVPPNAG